MVPISATLSALTPAVADAAIALALTFACQAQNSANIDLGRATLLGLLDLEMLREVADDLMVSPDAEIREAAVEVLELAEAG